MRRAYGAESKRWLLGPPSADRRPKSYRTGTNSPEEAVPFLSLLPPSEPQLGSLLASLLDLQSVQFDRGVDVIFAAAGITGFGALQAAKDAAKLAIGMDSTQNPLFPGTVLTSLLKRVDNAVYDAFTAARAGTWQPGVRSLGLAEHGIDYAMDDNNKALVTPEMREKAEAARAEIIAGRIRLVER